MFSFLSLFPGGSFFNLDNEGRAKTYYDCYSPYGLPLKFLNKNSVLYSILTLYDIEKIEEKNIISYFIGTTNPLLMNYNKIEFDCIINLDEDKITFNKKLNSNLLHMGKKENAIMNKLYKECKSLFKDNNTDDMDDNWMLDKEENKKDKNLKKAKKTKIGKKSIYLQNENENLSLFEGSDDYIRNIFKKYITDFLSDIKLSQYITKTVTLNNNAKLSKIKDVLNEYNCNFIYNWITKTKNFLFWNYECSSDLWKFSPHLKKCKNVKKIYENGDIYEGELSFGKPNNNGKLEFTIKEIPYTYVGEFSYGIKQGKGNLFTNDNKFNYDGDWKNDKYEGFGTLYDHGEKYTGDFKNGKFHGMGSFYKLNGDILEGDFFEGNLKKGKITYKNGDVYEGELENGIFNGYGIYKYKNGDIFKGKFLEGKKIFGNLEFSNNGGKYEGFFENDLYNGEGILLSKSGEVFKGIFKDGIFVKKLDKLKVEMDNEVFSEGVNIQIKQNDDWEIADVKKGDNKKKEKNKGNKIEDMKEQKKEEIGNLNIDNENKENINNIENNIYENEDNNYDNYNHIYENKFDVTTDSLDVVSYTNITNVNITQEDME